MSCSFTRQDVLDRLAVMKTQESTKRQHAARDYLRITTSTTSENDDSDSDETSSTITSSSESSTKEIEHKMQRMTLVANRMLTSKVQQATDAACREKMAMW